MGEAVELQQQNSVQEAKEQNTSENGDHVADQSKPRRFKHYKWWFKMAIYSVFVLSGQSAATILGRLYYGEGGKSKWMATLVQTAGFPILIPFLVIAPSGNHNAENYPPRNQPSTLVLASVYLCLGIFGAADCMLYSIGLQYLPVSTFSLIGASQLGFNAFFSYFLNSQKLTPFIVNSIVLLTISSILLVFEPDSTGPTKVPKGKYTIGFLCTLSASAGYALMLSLTQLVFTRILRSGTFKVVLKMIVYQSSAATCVILVGLFASGEWKSLNVEMEKFELGKLSYVMTLVWIAVIWQLFSIGVVGLIFQVSSLFSNVISTLTLPIVPVLAVIIFHDKMSGVKVVSMVLAIWGFVSYIYQHYLDDLKSKDETENLNRVSEVRLAEIS